jgi:HEPN domain-containing protein
VPHAKVLDKYYILTRYPNGFDEGIPGDYFTEEEAVKGIEYAEDIIQFSEDIFSRYQCDKKITEEDFKDMENGIP